MAASFRGDLFFGSIYGLALSAVVWTSVLSPPATDPACLLLLSLAAVAGPLRGRIARFGRWSLVYPAGLAALLLYGAGTSVVAAVVCASVGCWLRPDGAARRRSRSGFEIGVVALATAAGAVAHASLSAGPAPGALVLVAHAVVFSSVRQILVALAAGVTGRRRRVAAGLRRWVASVPALAAGLAVATLFAAVWSGAGSRTLIVAGVLLALTLGWFRSRRRQCETTRRQRTATRRLLRSFTDSLAELMEARDDATREHLLRVQRLCLCVGKRLDLTPVELEALAAASVLHDIGKVAVPEGILSKPGRLTAEEMDRIKIHPEVGARILERVPFPHPLGALVRHHHERWDGDGYPSGLRGETIPFGSRILAVVDTYDALTSTRPYRRALPHDEVVGFLRGEAGRMFDPDVVETLIEYLDEHPGLIPREVALEAVGLPELEPSEPEALGNLPLAQRELQTLYEISRAMGYGMNLDEYMTLVACKLSPLVPYRSLVVYFLETEDVLLRAGFAMGHAADKLRLMTIPLGERLSGWAALQKRAFIGQDHATPLNRDGSRSDLEEWANDAEMGELKSTLVAPMVADDRTLGVIALYDQAGRRFTPDERRVVLRVAGCAAQVVQRLGSRPEIGEVCLTDPLTGVPNARFLWLETAHRIARSRETGDGFGLLAFRVTGLEPVTEQLGSDAVDRLLGQLARRFAAACRESETLVRFGPDLFMVLSSTQRSGDLVERWHAMSIDVEHPAVVGHQRVVHQVRVSAAHAVFPDDGDGLEGLLETLDGRLSLSARRGRTVVPFRRPMPHSAGGLLPR